MSSYVDEQIRKMWTSTQNYREPKNDTVQTERQKWIKAIEDIKAEIKNDYHITCIEIIDKHTKELL